jgi:hypothetical protein
MTVRLLRLTALACASVFVSGQEEGETIYCRIKLVQKNDDLSPAVGKGLSQNFSFEKSFLK